MEKQKLWITFKLENEEMKDRFYDFIDSYEREIEVEELDDSKVVIIEEGEDNGSYESDSIEQLYPVMKDKELAEKLCQLQEELDELED